jgi:hypothetical protein
MDDDMSDLDLGDIDLLGLEDACKQKAFHAISPKQIQLIKEVLKKSRARFKLGIQNNPQKYPKNVPRDTKK